MLRPLLLALLLSTGCAAAKAGYAIQDAQRVVRDAVEARADERSVYQMTLAEQYLLKAREEDGYADFGAADKLARKAKEAAAKARKDADEGGVPMEDVIDLPESAKEIRTEDTSTNPWSTEDDDP